jgi:hypothetical protein
MWGQVCHLFQRLWPPTRERRIQEKLGPRELVLPKFRGHETEEGKREVHAYVEGEGKQRIRLAEIGPEADYSLEPTPK